MTEMKLGKWMQTHRTRT